MASGLYTVASGSDIQSSDIDQLVTAFLAETDLGTVSFIGPTAAPTTAPAATISTSSGNLVGTYTYVVTFVTGVKESYTGIVHITGETPAGPASASITTTSGHQVTVSSIPTGPVGVIARRLYRTKAGGTVYYLDQKINDNETTSVVDNVADSALGASAPTVNTTGTTFSIGSGAISFGSQTGSKAWIDEEGNASFLGNVTIGGLSITSAGLTVSSGETFTMNGTWAGTPIPNGMLAGNLVDSVTIAASDGITESVANPTGVGGSTLTLGLSAVPNSVLAGDLATSLSVTANDGVTATVTNPTGVGAVDLTLGLSAVPNSALAGNLVDSLTATDGLSVVNPTGVGAASYTIVLNGTTLSNGASGLSVNLANANTWSALQTFSVGMDLAGTVGGNFTFSGAPTFNAGLTVASGQTLNGAGSVDVGGTGTFGGAMQSAGATLSTAAGQVVKSFSNIQDDGAGNATTVGTQTVEGGLIVGTSAAGFEWTFDAATNSLVLSTVGSA